MVRGARRAPATATLALIDGFELRVRGRQTPLSERAQRLLAFLALRAHPIERQHLAGVLWLDSPEHRAMANLRSTLWRMRSVASLVLVDVGRQLTMNPRVVVDVRGIEDHARRVLDGAMPDADGMLALSSAGELLPYWDEDWVLIERERFHQLRLHALESMCDRLVSERRFGWAIETCLAAVSREPLRESAHRALIRAYLAEGNTGDAITHYRTYRQLILDELGLEPSTQMAELLEGVMLR